MLRSSVAERVIVGSPRGRSGVGGEFSDGLLEAGGRPCDFERDFAETRFLRKPPMLRPRVSMLRSEIEDMEESGRGSTVKDDDIAELVEKVEMRLEAVGVASVGVLGATSPSNETNVAGVLIWGSVRMIRSLRLGAGLQGVVDGANVSFWPACSRK